MPGRSIPLVNGEFYHVVNRGVASQPVFLDKYDYRQAMLGLRYYGFAEPPVKLSEFKMLARDQREQLWAELFKKDNRLVEIVCFVLMPNHFHFLLRQVADGGTSTFVSRFTNSYTRFFNVRNDRVGPLFQGVFRAVHVTTEEQLVHVSRYIHLNPLVSFVVDDSNFLSYPWSSLPEYLGQQQTEVTAPDLVLAYFKSSQDYLQFVLDQADYAKKLEMVKHLGIE